MLVDLVLAVAHHLLFFALISVFAAQMVLVRPGLAGAALSRVARLDASYGMIAGLVILVGGARVIFGLKGWEFYVSNWAFWAKMAAFALVGGLSAIPTLRILEWKRALAADQAFQVPDAAITGVQKWLRLEGLLFLLIPVFAAIMARN
ncbi:DUF2214 family protein [Mesorhizobium sp. NBSH29]|uniref:DUF2214 family protein n=1 Tax=Mesorhizobium sp. NBSH29 TaxID=2654249 RepID=UPI001896436D|nr:DUF2214 family protein [Mesorhizobium sp. NBSH29]QPC86188.1 DUF2214 family protein [Mesorhizobium sp. NBSH29]